MSDTMHCRVCRSSGRRRRDTLCPEGWLYAVVTDDEDVGQEFVVTVCSKECALLYWSRGPGVLVRTRQVPSPLALSPKAEGS